MCYSPSEAMDAEKVNNFAGNDYEEFDLPPEYCRYQDEGCELATTHLGYKSNCLDCPFPQCIYDEPRGRQRCAKRLRNREIARLYDRLKRLEDRNIDTVSKAEQRGEAYLRQAEIESANGAIGIPPNCGQQLYDVIDITDSRAGLSEEKKRVMGLTLVYNPRRGEYEQRLSLGAV